MRGYDDPILVCLPKICMEIPSLFPLFSLRPSRAAHFESGLNVQSVGEHIRCTTFESNVLFTLRFMVDTKVRGGRSGALRTAKPLLPCKESIGLMHCPSYGIY